MSSASDAIIIADSLETRADWIRHLILDRFGQSATTASSWNGLCDKAKALCADRSSRDLIVVLQDRLDGRSTTDSVDTLFLQWAVQGGVIVVVDRDWHRPGNLDSRAVGVESDGRTVDRNSFVAAFRGFLPDRKVRPRVNPVPADDLILSQQLRSIGGSGDPRKGILRLEYILAKLWPDCNSAEVRRLTQGFSGSLVLHVAVTTNDTTERFVVKLSHKSDLSKLRNWATNWEEVEEALNSRGLNPYILPPVRPAQPVPDYPFLVSSGDYYAEAWPFLGRDLVDLVDFEAAYIRRRLRPEKLVQANYFAGPDQDLAEAFLRHVMRVLDSSWHDDSGDNVRIGVERKVPLWVSRNEEDEKPRTPPPYSLANWWKSQIVSSLERLETLGQRLLPLSFQSDSQVIENWIKSGPNRSGKLGRDRNVAVGPVHGDLNMNNIILSFDHQKPFLIDFAKYQSSGHVMQDFACLETNIKFALMDCEEDSQAEAFDLTVDRLELWTDAESQLFDQPWSTADQNVDESAFAEGRDNVETVIRAWKLIEIVRDQGRVVHRRAIPTNSRKTFPAEYGAALLYHTLRAIGYRTLSPFKQLLAVYSAARLIRSLNR